MYQIFVQILMSVLRTETTARPMLSVSTLLAASSAPAATVSRATAKFALVRKCINNTNKTICYCNGTNSMHVITLCI